MLPEYPFSIGMVSVGHQNKGPGLNAKKGPVFMPCHSKHNTVQVLKEQSKKKKKVWSACRVQSSPQCTVAHKNGQPHQGITFG